MKKTYKTIIPTKDLTDEMANGGCCLCGRKLKNEHNRMLHLMPDGTLVDDKDDPITEIAYCAELGYWGCGATCINKYSLTPSLITNLIRRLERVAALGVNKINFSKLKD